MSSPPVARWAIAAALVAGCIERAPSLPVEPWRQALDRLGVSPAGLDRSAITFAPDIDPGIGPDGALQLPSSWLASPMDPPVLARVAHLARHRARGLPDMASLPCLQWRMLMLAEELDGLSVEATVLARLAQPPRPAELAAALAERVVVYRARCPDASAP